MPDNTTVNTHESKWMPLLASGRFNIDYNIIRIYHEIARERNVSSDKAILDSEDLVYLKKLAENSPTDLYTAIDLLSKRFVDRIDPSIATETIKRYTGAEVDEKTAVNMIAKTIAMWCIEAGEILGYIRLRESYR